MNIFTRLFSLYILTLGAGNVSPDDLKGTIPGYTKTTDLPTMVFNGVGWLMGFGGVVAACAVIYGGYVYLTADGDDDKTKLGSTIVTDTLVGLVLLMLAVVIVRFVIKTVMGLQP